jgi:sporulation protein YqfC
MQKGKDFFERLGERLDIPREALPGGFGLTLSGGSELVVRGCRRILRYEAEEICLSVGKTALTVRGKGLFCSAFGAGSVTVTGEIAAIYLSEVGK